MDEDIGEYYADIDFFEREYPEKAERIQEEELFVEDEDS